MTTIISKPTELILIAAVARDRVIGKDNALLWHLPADLKHFKTLTQGHAVIMGRKTWESLPEKFRPLPGRKNVVISRNAAFVAPGAILVGSLEAALAACADEATAFIIGGADIYAQALPMADRMELTEIDADFDGDAFFPTWDANEWREASREVGASSEFSYTFASYRRR